WIPMQWRTPLHILFRVQRFSLSACKLDTVRRNLVIGFRALGACHSAAAQSAPLSSTAFHWLDAVKDEKTRAKVSPYRVPAVYLTSAFLRFFSVLLFRRISKLRSIN